ncbi:hypothetical protein SCHPADRAFT_896903 [Schizopora paradoxa]|uniref:Uncharacterized protein n=1 Tax=Schizopora paradoxa TaxID=27342 RepID=A0A0H2R037_9AGAM|nr:hypothetical protein SCHPADRAFT_896903 [Schizopora paradoxa]
MLRRLGLFLVQVSSRDDVDPEDESAHHLSISEVVRDFKSRSFTLSCGKFSEFGRQPRGLYSRVYIACDAPAVCSLRGSEDTQIFCETWLNAFAPQHAKFQPSETLTSRVFLSSSRNPEPPARSTRNEYKEGGGCRERNHQSFSRLFSSPLIIQPHQSHHVQRAVRPHGSSTTSAFTVRPPFSPASATNAVSVLTPLGLPFPRILALPSMRMSRPSNLNSLPFREDFDIRMCFGVESEMALSRSNSSFSPRARSQEAHRVSCIVGECQRDAEERDSSL